LLDAEVRRIVTEKRYQPTVFFIRNQGFVRPTAARRISYADSLAFERLHEQVYRDVGFRRADIPAAPLADRVALIRQALSA
jgi:predicted ATPase